jgi:hypothetical protein
MTVYGYARVSTDGQSLASQDAQLHAAGCAKVYCEKVSGARTDRPELAKLLRRLDEGDVVMVTGWIALPDPRATCSTSSIQSARRAPVLADVWADTGPPDADHPWRACRVRARVDPCPYR